KQELAQRLAGLAEQHGYSYGKVIIRNQKTRWGSCSHRNTISLNIKLALLPDELRDYVMLHELVHTGIRNHGPGFWAKLDGLTGDARGMARRLRNYDLRLF
ncbi:MAG: M48 family metallopeptidase, partial [Dehalococcoidales bacterium]|nr:M48 family metallopeptidase [Dehalococcoidales bacterium]